eukprot:CAMPEP_0184403586 /NCGR_PEP_ID=MMETSP0007-20130409/85493_1 /TAXON_ID=97485 /ORGANISM="Prymnesium parvum, Strain Texoma1" /LENGTH=142 /DNA_ID=CAMNT_0026759701 /DNA_START=965 /DNA_END=1390 /DNA_ORIENTATION=-
MRSAAPVFIVAMIKLFATGFAFANATYEKPPLAAAAPSAAALLAASPAVEAVSFAFLQSCLHPDRAGAATFRTIAGPFSETSRGNEAVDSLTPSRCAQPIQLVLSPRRKKVSAASAVGGGGSRAAVGGRRRIRMPKASPRHK